MKVKTMLQCHLLVTGLTEHVDTVPRLAALESLLACADKGVPILGDASSWLCQSFGVERQHDWPVAPYAALGDGLSVDEQYWLRVDPVHLQLLRDRMLVQPCPSLSADEAELIIQALNQYFSDDDLRFYAPSPERWYMASKHISAMQTHALYEVLGQDAASRLPYGTEAMLWQGRLNEIQMLLHAHPVNLAREQAGVPAVNSVWLWGGGELCTPVMSPFIAVYAHDVLARGLAMATRIPANAGQDSLTVWLDAVPDQGSGLVVLNNLSSNEALENPAVWHAALGAMEALCFEPLMDAIKSDRIATLHLYVPGVNRIRHFMVNRRGLRKFWRRRKPVKVLLDD